MPARPCADPLQRYAVFAILLLAGCGARTDLPVDDTPQPSDCDVIYDDATVVVLGDHTELDVLAPPAADPDTLVLVWGDTTPSCDDPVPYLLGEPCPANTVWRGLTYIPSVFQKPGTFPIVAATDGPSIAVWNLDCVHGVSGWGGGEQFQVKSIDPSEVTLAFCGFPNYWPHDSPDGVRTGHRCDP
jgi:hypothetical protein